MILTVAPSCRWDVNSWLRYGAAGLKGYRRFLGYHARGSRNSKLRCEKRRRKRISLRRLRIWKARNFGRKYRLEYGGGKDIKGRVFLAEDGQHSSCTTFSCLLETIKHIPLQLYSTNYRMAPAAIEEIKLVTEHLPGDMSETPSPDGPLYAVASSRPSSISTATWLKLNSNAPTHIKVEEVPVTPQDEPFTGAKKLRHLLENTDELVVCPGVYDGLSARTAIELGFKSLYMVSILHQHRLLSEYPITEGIAVSAFTDPLWRQQTGAGTTASRLGQPDLAIAQLADMRDNADMIANLDPFGPPLIADMDTGYGGT